VAKRNSPLYEAEPLYGGAPKKRRGQSKWSSLPKRGDNNAVSGMVLSLFTQSRNMRRTEEGNWYIDSRYLSGDQWVIWDPRHLTLTVRAKKHWRIRQTINHMREGVELLVNMLTARRPRLNIIPGSSEPEDRQSAIACERLLSYLWDQLEVDEHLDEVIVMMAVTGRAFLKLGWDKQAGEILELPDYDSLPENVVPGPGMEIPMLEQPIGEITLDFVSPFNMHVDPSATRLKKARWAGHEQYMHIEEARQRWPEMAEKIGADGGQDVWYNYARRLQYESGAQSTAEDVQDTVTVREMYFRPDGKNPNGRKIVIAGKVVVEDVDNPYPGGDFPYIDFLCYPNPGAYWGQGTVNLGRNAQTSFNRARSHWMELLRKHGNPQWMKARGSGVSNSELTDEPGNVIDYNPIFAHVPPVKQVEGQQPPPGWTDLMSLDLQDLRGQMGVVDVMRGVNPPGVRSGRSIAYLTEQNMGRHGPVVRRFERSIQQWGRMALRMAKKFYAEDRLLTLLGDGSAAEVHNLKMSDLKSARDVRVVTGSAEPESRIARQDFIMELWDRGLIVNDAGMPDQKRALSMIEMMNPYEPYSSDQHDKQWALEENELMAMGNQVPAEPHDNHPLHSEQHVAFMRTAKYRGLPEETRFIFRAHLDMHIEIMSSHAGGEPQELPGPPGEGGEGEPIDEGAPEPRTDLRGGP
jgi:hypothetical protein